MATLDTDSADVKRQKNIYEDLGMGFVVDLAMGASKFVTAAERTISGVGQSNQWVG